MANDPKSIKILDPLTAAVTGLDPSTLEAPIAQGGPSIVPQIFRPATETPDVPATLKPTLGTDAQLNAPTDAMSHAEPTLSADGGTVTLPAHRGDSDNPGFLAKLGRLAAGMTGLSDPDSSPQAGMGAKIGELAGRVGNGLAESAGTPMQKQLANERIQMPLKSAQIQNEMEARRAMAANAANKTNLQYGPEGTSRMTAEAAQQNADSNEGLRDAHQKQIEASLNGQVHVMPQIAQMIGRPELADQNIPPIRYQQEVSNVLKSLGAKTVDLGKDGVWGASPLTGRITRLGDSPSVARADSMLLRTQLPVNDAQGNTLGWVNPQTNSYTPVGDIHGKNGGAPLSEAVGGNVIPPKPTSSVLSRGQVAQTILPQVPVIREEISDLADKIGPGAGRWNDFWVNRGGVNDPAYAGLNQDLQLYATAIGLAHFGASMPEGFVKDMMRDFGTAQSPQDLTARIDHAEVWVQDYASRVGGGNAVPKPSTNVPNSSTPPAKKQSFADWQKSQAKTGGQ